MAGLLSVRVLPSLPAPAVAWNKTAYHVRLIPDVKLSSHGFAWTQQCPHGGRRRTSVMPVRAAASLSELAPTAAAVYGSLLLGGGLFAYTRSSSKGSLLGGLSGGVLMGVVFLLSLNPEMQDLGEAIGFGTALLFVAVFGIRFAATKKVFPAAPLLLISIVASAVFVGAYLQDRV